MNIYEKAQLLIYQEFLTAHMYLVTFQGQIGQMK